MARGEKKKDKKPGVKIIQPIQIDWSLFQNLVNAKVAKPPTVPKMEQMEKWVLARHWEISTEHDKTLGLTVATIECPGPDGPLYFKGHDATMALATAKAIVEAHLKGPKQVDMFDEEYYDEDADEGDIDATPAPLFDLPIDGSGGAAVEINPADTERELLDEINTAYESGKEEMREQLERAGAEMLDEVRAAFDVFDEPASAGDFDNPLLPTIDEDGNVVRAEPASDGETMPAEESAAAREALDYILSPEGLINQPDESDGDADGWWFLHVVDTSDMAAWKEAMPLVVKWRDGGDEIEFDRGYYLKAGYTYDHAEGAIFNLETNELEWSRQAPKIGTSAETAREIESSALEIDLQDEQAWLEFQPRAVTATFEPSGAWTFELDPGIRYVRETGELFNAAGELVWTRAYPKLGTSDESVSPRIEFPDVPNVPDLEAESHRRIIVATTLTNQDIYPVLFVDAETLEYITAPFEGDTENETAVDAAEVEAKYLEVAKTIEEPDTEPASEAPADPEAHKRTMATMAQAIKKDIDHALASSLTDPPRESLGSVSQALIDLGATIQPDGSWAMPSRRGRMSAADKAARESFDKLHERYHDLNGTASRSIGGDDLPSVGAGNREMRVEEILTPR